MNTIKFGFFYLLETILRFLPWPQKTGLIKIGHPDKNSPVLVTGNYHLTVLKVKRALRGHNVFLLVVDSRGINVWCAAAGGHLTQHDVVSAIKLTGIERLVAHRRVILPQLAACGVEAREIHLRTGWDAKWGPVDIRDFPAYFASGMKKRKGMNTVRFPLLARMEMAVAWAFWMSVVYSLVLWILNRSTVLPALILVWLLSLMLFSLFPVYLPLLRPKGGEKLWEKRRKGRIIFLSALLFLALTGLGVYSLLTSRFALAFLLFWGVLVVVSILFIGGDLSGSTPLLISQFREEMGFVIEVDDEKCRGDGICANVCPQECFILDKRQHLAILEKPDSCIYCGACIVQCQFDALHYKDAEGKSISPDIIRKHKVGLSGKRKKMRNK
jgi:NAD-dependent dihydropyrimidine dehydrogenase PreA subunit